ncbi:response regulator [Thermobrachium celere]|uniref:response regulator n=1 Tax=Thermobrachium celere TaxID=53422 RepID=UPI001941D06C|nr:response regulator [Thermobrachium celere]GFR36047.1 two-component system response regulator [Thermobrachium celere]
MKNDRKKHLLLVDDSNLTQITIKKILELEGYIVDVSVSAEDALNQIKSRDIPYDLIITDIHFPQRDGFYIIDTLKSNKEYSIHKSTPIMILSADATSTTVRRAVEKGAKEYLNKPFTTKELISRIKKLLLDTEESLYSLLIECLNEEIERAKRGKYELSLVIASREFSEGILIEEVVKEVKTELRKVDTVIELGKSTLALVLPFTNLNGANVVVNKIKANLNEKWYFGITNFPNECQTVEELYRLAKQRINNEINKEIVEKEQNKEEMKK